VQNGPAGRGLIKVKNEGFLKSFSERTSYIEKKSSGLQWEKVGSQIQKQR